MDPCCSIISEECCLHLPSSMLAASPHSGSKGAEQYQASQLQSICSTKQNVWGCVSAAWGFTWASQIGVCVVPSVLVILEHIQTSWLE